MKRYLRLRLMAALLLVWIPRPMDSALNRNLKGEHIYSLNQAGLSLQERIKQAEEKFLGTFRGEYFLSGYTFEARGNVRVGGTTIDCRGESVSRISRQGDRLVVRTFSHGFNVEENDGWEISDRDMILLHKKNRKGFEIVDAIVLDAGLPYELKEIPFFWLGTLKAAESLEFLKKLFEQSQDRSQRNVLAAIALHRHPGAVDFIAAIARQHGFPVELRKHAVFWLGAVKESKALSILKKMVSSESEYSLRKQLVFAFYLNGSSEAVQEMIQIARHDSSSSLRKNSIFWLGQKASKECVRVLEKVVEGDEELEVKSSAVFAISQLQHSKAVPMLIRIARENRHPQIRKKAMFWLGEIGDQEALKFFEEILLK